MLLTVAPDVLRPPNGETLIAGFYRIAMNSADISVRFLLKRWMYCELGTVILCIHDVCRELERLYDRDL